MHTCSSCCSCPKAYGFFNFIWDAFMTCITGGFWIVYIFIREMRGKRG